MSAGHGSRLTSLLPAAPFIRYFLKQIATRIINVEHQKLKDFKGDYEYYLTLNDKEAAKMEVAGWLAGAGRMHWLAGAGHMHWLAGPWRMHSCMCTWCSSGACCDDSCTACMCAVVSCWHPCLCGQQYSIGISRLWCQGQCTPCHERSTL